MSKSVQVCWVKRIDNSRLVRQRHPGAVRESAALVGVSLVCLAILLLCAWQDFEFVHSGYRQEELRSQHEQLQEWNRTLRLEQAALTDPMRIEALARNQLGLEAPAAGQVIPLGSGEAPALVPVLARLGGQARAAPARPPTRVSFAD